MRLEDESNSRRVFKDFEITRIIYSNSERSEQFLKQNAFLTCYRRFHTLEQIKIRLEKIIGIQKPTGKVKKNNNMINLTPTFYSSELVCKGNKPKPIPPYMHFRFNDNIHNTHTQYLLSILNFQMSRKIVKQSSHCTAKVLLIKYCDGLFSKNNLSK